MGFSFKFAKHNRFFLLLIVLLSVIGFYSPTLKNGFIYLDDDTHILENTTIRALSANHIQKIFTTTVDRVYAPLTFLSFAFEYHFFKYEPFIYHLNNLLLHLAVSALVFYLAIRLGLSDISAFIAALLFGIHPMHVESVAWITERKDVLYAFFYMLALHSYWEYLDKRKIIFYLSSIIFGFLSILSKPMALSLPLVLFLCDWFKKRPFDKSMLIDKIPHFVYIVPIAWITYSLNARIPGENIHSGFIIWVWTCVFYIHKFFYPVTLVPMYALPEPITISNPHYFGAVGLLILFAVILLRLRHNPWVIFAALFYFLSMFFLFRYDNAVDKNIVADRFIYLPCLGICFLVGHAAEKLLKQKAIQKIVFFALVLTAGLLGTKTFHQTQLWKDNILFWNHELKHYPKNPTAYGNRGEAYKDIGKYDLAMADFNNAIAADSKYAEGYNSRGQLYAARGNMRAAENDFLKAIELNSRFDEAYNNLGIVYLMKEDPKQAVLYFQKAVHIDPRNVEAHTNLGNFYYDQQKFDEALIHFEKVLALNPNSATGHNKRGLIYGMRQKYDLALRDFNQSIDLDPSNSEAYTNRGIVFEQLKMLAKALENYNKAIALNPQYADAHYGRGNVYARQGMFDKAASDFSQALKINPQHLGAQKSQQLLNKLIIDKNDK